MFNWSYVKLNKYLRVDDTDAFYIWLLRGFFWKRVSQERGEKGEEGGGALTFI